MRLSIVGVLLCAALGTACSPGGAEPERAAPRQTTVAVPAGFKRFGGAGNGVTVAVPRGWAALDLSREDPGPVLKRVGLAGSALRRARRGLAPLVTGKALWAADPASVRRSPDGFATNLNAFCRPVPALPPDRLISTATRELAHIEAKVAEAGQAVIASGTAVRLVYTYPARGLRIHGTQYHVPAGERTCVVTLSTDRDGAQALFDRIGRTIAPA